MPVICRGGTQSLSTLNDLPRRTLAKGYRLSALGKPLDGHANQVTLFAFNNDSNASDKR